MARTADPPPLAGVRIVDLTRLGYGAQATALCGAMGAEVIRVESRTRPDPIRLMPPFVPLPGEERPRAAGLSATATREKGFNRGGIFFKCATIFFGVSPSMAAWISSRRLFQPGSSLRYFSDWP